MHGFGSHHLCYVLSKKIKGLAKREAKARCIRADNTGV